MIRWLKRSALLLLFLVVAVVFGAWWLMRGSLPQLNGELALHGLSAPVSVQRDRLGVVTIDATNETDAMRALGYVHAQERYFEMDLMRRTAAGELAALFGPIALETDKEHRVHRMRARVMADLDAIAGDRLPQLQAYTDGVNAGLADLKVRPWPYLLLRQQPKPWLPADSALTGYAMYFDLQDSTNARELALWKIERHVPPALFALLARDGSSWDAPLIGRARGDAVLPTAEQVDLRKLPAPDTDKPDALVLVALPEALEIGSNNFAVSGALTSDGRAIVADDMHLGLRAPNIWFRARLRYADARAPRGKVDVSGFTLPGLPAVVVGSNGHVAWGYTNSYIDTTDWMRLTLCAPKTVAAAPCAPVSRHREIIDVAGGAAATFDVEETAWGPVLHREPDGKALALRWTAQLPGSISFGIANLPAAGNLAQALAVADHAAMPTQNLVLGDANGEIAWRLLGPVPERTGACSAAHLVENGDPPDAPLVAASARDGGCGQWGIRTDDAPALKHAPAGRLWTANNRIVDGETLARVGDSGYALGARARQIRDDLFGKQQFDERGLLAIQLDDRALFLARWWQLLRDEAARTESPALQELADAAASWQDRASTDSVSYRIVRAWRLAVNERIANGLTAPAQVALGKDFEMPALQQLEGVAWPLVTQRPAHLLSRRFANWDALFEDAAEQVRDELLKEGPLAQRTWGERNTAAICHPLARAIPLFGKRLLCMPPDQLAGDSNMPRVVGPAVGASERMVVSPGHEADGILHMPGGQSGNPLSPFWGAGHDDWVHGRPTPFLPGQTEYTLRLKPR
ncbi:MAG: penicillin acylase family protein [Luteimonas sp.]|nr:penicillin acylase family protein [Luteimonas sp.]